MFPVKHLLQFSILLLVIASGVVLGLSQGNLELTLVAVVGGLAGYIITDWIGWFKIRGIVANLASVAVLFYAMKDFMAGDGAAKLVCVSNLLVYLQTVLMFQEKTPRLNWQLMVLSLLQIVVAAIFNLDFEGGMLFVLYFAIVGVTLFLQGIYSNNWKIIQHNKSSARLIGDYLDSQETLVPEQMLLKSTEGAWNRPMTFFDSVQKGSSALSRVVQHLGLWLVAALVFSSILFYIIPRGGEAWFGPQVMRATAIGMTKEVNLDERDVIEPSTILVMRSWFTNEKTNETLRPRGPVYFRGMALSHFSIKNGNTNWSAPYDRVFPSVYQKLRLPRGLRNTYTQTVSLQPTNDPLLYSTTPTLRHERTPIDVDHCFELSAISRRNAGDSIEKSPYVYEVSVALSKELETLDSFPYLSDQMTMKDEPMYLHNRGQHRWLTHLDKTRYPNLLRTANEIASRFDPEERMALVKALERHFVSSNEYSYTLDYRNVPRDESLDSIEDFHCNHKTGHCEVYASALTLMLRGLGIPARLVVGFYGSEYDEDDQCYRVREADAHAWVEVYLRPEHCSREMMVQGAAGRGGAWLRLDPTPPDVLEDGENSGGNTIESARTLWQDYVLGLDSTKQEQSIFGKSSAKVLGLFDLSNWNSAFQEISENVEENPTMRIALSLGLLIAVVVGLWIAWLKRAKNKRMAGRKSKKQIGGLRRILGGALSFISPELGKWVMGGVDQQASSWFYRKMLTMLEPHGLKRAPSQTHREFASLACERLSEYPESAFLKETVNNLTELFYRVRFGEQELDPARQQEVKQTLEKLASTLPRT